MMQGQLSKVARRWLWVLALSALVLWLYASAVNYGLIWDDPLWYQQGAGQTPWQIFTALPTYQFYRPLAILLNRQLVAPNGVVNASFAHAIQIAAHLLASVLCAPALRALGFGPKVARLAAVLFALCPLAWQAVAWQAPQQPLTTLGVLCALLAAHRFQRTQQARWLALSLLFYAAALLFQESAVVFGWIFFWINREKLLVIGYWLLQRRITNNYSPITVFWPLLHLLLAALYLLIWLNVPRQAGVTGAGFQANVLAYLLQGVVYPLAHGLALGQFNWPVEIWLGIFAMGGGMLLALAGAWRPRVVGALWVSAGLLPAWAGLAWDYVGVGSRLFYPALLGIAALWACAIIQLWETRRTLLRVCSAALLAWMVALSLGQWAQFKQLYERGTGHLAQTIAVLATEPTRTLTFVNYPDRLMLRPAPYPLGEWGLVLAPIVQDLGDFARVSAALGAADHSLAVFLTGVAEREQWPYAVNMRGENTAPENVLAAALASEAVYLTDYLPGGELRLRWVGGATWLPADSSPARVQASFGRGDSPALQLEASTIAQSTLTLQWRSHQPLPDTTIFVHVLQEGVLVASADGDALGGMVPLWVWQANTAITDVRSLADLALPAGAYQIFVGLYNRQTGAREPAFDAAGQRWPEDAVPIGTLQLP